MHFKNNDGKMATAAEEVDKKTVPGLGTSSVHYYCV